MCHHRWPGTANGDKQEFLQVGGKVVVDGVTDQNI
jgi:hypothetical protein